MNEARWTSLMGALGIAPSPDTFHALAKAYGEKHRGYHNAGHIAACLLALDEFRELAERPEEVEAALWFHDAVYNPHAGDNEARSAEWARAFLLSAGRAADSAQRVHDHVMATRHATPAASRDGALVADLDLSILGADRTRYDAFEKGVRKEYRWVPGFLFRSRRKEILSGFLRRDAIYHHGPVRAKLEAKARENLARAIAELGR